MLFNAAEFIYLFLPLTLAGYLALRGELIQVNQWRWPNQLLAQSKLVLAGLAVVALAVIILQQWQKIAALAALASLLVILLKHAPSDPTSRLRMATFWLVICSLLFYAWWRPIYLLLIGLSIVVNYRVGVLLGHQVAGNSRAKMLLFIGVAFNLALIGWFKYAHFFAGNVNLLAGTDFNFSHIVLPLAISFFTFQQIAYLVDAYAGEAREYSFLNYCLFVTFFPQLIAGPIVHHKEMLPQFSQPLRRDVHWEFLAMGLIVFALGLFKKAIIADGYAPYANGVFDGALAGASITFFEGWAGALAYTVQLYFDFSGYSDMAIGLGLMFGIRLPLNFNSPYKARNIIDFWRRWHITLSRFLRDYLYIPLGGNRKGKTRRYVNLGITMLLGGLWHGAAWSFVIWGALHGFYLIVNHAWHALSERLGWRRPDAPVWRRAITSTMAWLITFLAVVVAWVYFRAESLTSAHEILAAMFGLNGIAFPVHWEARLSSLGDLGGLIQFSRYETIGAVSALIYLLPALAMALFGPNTQQIVINGTEHVRLNYPMIQPWMTGTPWASLARVTEWRISHVWLLITVAVGAYAAVGQTGVSQFLYFNF